MYLMTQRFCVSVNHKPACRGHLIKMIRNEKYLGNSTYKLLCEFLCVQYVACLYVFYVVSELLALLVVIIYCTDLQ